jgi:hypothetical protein
LKKSLPFADLSGIIENGAGKCPFAGTGPMIKLVFKVVKRS